MESQRNSCCGNRDSIKDRNLFLVTIIMMATVGLPQYIIEYFGGWADNNIALRETYIKIAAKGAGVVSEIFSRGYCSSLEETGIREAKLIWSSTILRTSQLEKNY